MDGRGLQVVSGSQTGAKADKDRRCQEDREKVEVGLTGRGDSLDVKSPEMSSQDGFLVSWELGENCCHPQR